MSAADTPSDSLNAHWCRQVHAMLTEGGTWVVPRSGLVFTRRGSGLLLTGILDMEMPRNDQLDDYWLIVKHFREAGIEITYDEEMP